MKTMHGLLTLDVEDWEHANFTQLESRHEDITESVRARAYRMDANTDRWIELLGNHGARSTCFVLGEFAKRYPEAVLRLHRSGHEIGSHGPTHDLVYNMDRSAFREFLKRGLGELGELTGVRPVGFRAPSWSVDDRVPWYQEELANARVRYDSSEFPVKTPLYGTGKGPLEPRTEQGVLRIPVTVLTLLGARIPFSSGAFFRLAPLPMIRAGFRQAKSRNRPAMVVLHPRELDPAHPRLPLKGWEGWVHYARLGSTIPKLEALLAEGKWTSIREVYSTFLDTPAGAP
ncbi:MAG: polysaccharide deacetylase family protein [Bdellovibrionota bacterium]